jgi:sialidase-1
MHRLVSGCAALLFVCSVWAEPQAGTGIKKLRDIVIYKDDAFYCSFPSIVRRPDGELLVAFRRAPNRTSYGGHLSHSDANSYLELVRSRDNGDSWSPPELLYAHPFGGSQDPCMVQLRDGVIVCTSYGWCLMPQGASKRAELAYNENYSFLGGYLLRSEDGGHHWSDPIYPPPTPGEKTLNVFGKPVPAYNRGAMCQGSDGRLYWVVAKSAASKGPTSTHLMISRDEGKTWQYSCPVAKDATMSFNETSIYETPKGDLVAFIRTEGFNDHTVVARSTDHGKTFQKWEDTGFQGHPHYALRLPDKRVLLIYGYRHEPFGVRARVLDAECRNFGGQEIVLRQDGNNGDLGYPWATMISNDRALVVYYFHTPQGIRYIAGTILEVASPAAP